MAGQVILLIDDERPWTQATADLLRGEGFQVQIAEDGEKGLEFLDHGHSLLVILDVNLPRLNGLEVLRELRDKNPVLPVIVVSADDQSSLIAQAMEQGASTFLRKPIAPGLLLRAIRRLVVSIQSEDPTPTPVE